METWQIISLVVLFSVVFIGLGFMGGYGIKLCNGKLDASYE